MKDTRSPDEWRTWLKVAENTYRLAVPGGWMYRYTYGNHTMVFVPLKEDT